MMQKIMVAWRAELVTGEVKRGSVGVPALDPAAACRRVAGAIRAQYGFDLDDLTVQAIGPA